MRYIISGVAMSGNKGASGMAEALIQNLSKLDSNAFFLIFSYYPGADRLQFHSPNVEIINGSPKRVVLLFFVILWTMIGRSLGLTKSRCVFSQEMKLIASADVWLDASGISFVDGREKFLIFNLLSILPALVLNIPVIKVAQAMGPFNNFLNRIAAKIILPRLAMIVARGKTTADYLAELRLKNVKRYSDVAFSLVIAHEKQTLIPGCQMPEGKYLVGFSPSQVVWKLCKKKDVDYLGILKRSVERQIEEGNTCIIFPHSARAGSKKTHNNDLPLIKIFAEMLPKSPKIKIVEEELSAGALRLLIGKLDLLVASRFHAIVSAMATGVPVVVIGWSHKYAEVLAPFKLDEFVVSYEMLSDDEVKNKINMIVLSRKDLSIKIAEISAMIVKDNEMFFNEVLEIGKGGQKGT